MLRMWQKISIMEKIEEHHVLDQVKKVIKHLEDGVLENAKDIFSRERNLPPH